MTTHTTKVILVTVTVLLIIWDIYAYMAGGAQPTISRVIYETSTKHPILPFIFGVLIGHFFWAQDRKS